MEFVAIIIVAAVTFGLCFLVDRLFTRKFRNRQQHLSGLSVRLNKRFGSFGIIFAALGIAAIFAALNGSGWYMGAAGGLIVLVGVGLIVYYMTFGVYYDQNSFILNTFGKRSVTYQYGDILGQQLYMASGNVVIELQLKDGRTVGLQASMDGVYPFLDTAFDGWCRQTGRDKDQCDFHDPQNSLWFPSVEAE